MVTFYFLHSSTFLTLLQGRILPHLLIDLFIYLYQYGFINQCYHYLFSCSGYPNSGHWEFFQGDPSALLTCLYPLKVFSVSFFWAFLYLLASHDISGSLCIFLVLTLKSTTCPRNSGLHWRMVCRNLDLGAAYVPLHVVAPRPSQWRELGSTCILIHAHTHLYLCIILSVYILKKKQTWVRIHTQNEIFKI